MPNLTGLALERRGKEIFESLGFDCIIGRKQTRLDQLFAAGAFAHGEHLELDFLIPCNNVCLIGEITSRSNSTDIKRKYQKFKTQITLLTQLELTQNVWELLGVPEEKIHLFADVIDIKSFFISSNFKQFDVDWELSDSIVHFFDTDFLSIEQYAKCTGKYCRNYFIRLFDLNVFPAVRRPLLLGQHNHNLLRTTNKIIAGGMTGSADIFTFEASPYELIPYSHVFRRDLLPDLATNSAAKYQRPLILSKLDKIRSSLVSNPNFMFPNSILTVLSNECQYNLRRNALEIPDTYGAMSVIDGQHRLFSYANETIERLVGEVPKIMVTAIKFHEGNQNICNKYSAKTFIEINMNQTKIEPTHLDAIAYDILGETTPKAIAAHVILKLNERNSSVKGLFDTNQTKKGIIPTKTVLVEIRRLTNISIIDQLEIATRGKRYLKKLGHENILSIDFTVPLTNDQIVEKYIVCLQRYFNYLNEVFTHDFPKRGAENNSQMKYAKIIAAFVRLLVKFINEGKNWREVKTGLESIRNALMRIEGRQEYDSYLLSAMSQNFPSIQESATTHYNFLNGLR